MKLTRKQALNETIELFEKLAEKAREGKAVEKSKIPGPWLNYSACCPCCEYNKYKPFSSDGVCKNCPMKGHWMAGCCVNKKSPYTKWFKLVASKQTDNITPCCIDIEFFCLLIADLAREAKKNIKGENDGNY